MRCLRTLATLLCLLVGWLPNTGLADEPAVLDVDADGRTTALGDGIIVLRYLFGFRSDALIAGATSTASQRDAGAIVDYLAGRTASLDIDGNGTGDPLTDGLLLLRHLFGFGDNALTAGAIGSGATRISAASVEGHLQPLLVQLDTDRDGTANFADEDDDGDGAADVADAFPLDAAESVDTDRDLIGNNADPDDDNDQVADGEDLLPLDAARTRAIAAQFPRQGNAFVLPDYPVTRQLNWILQQLTVASTSIAEIEAHFDPATLAQTPAATWQTLLQTLRTQLPNARVVDVIGVTPVQMTALIGNPDVSQAGRFINLGTRYAGAGLITTFSASNFPLNGTVQFVADQSLSLGQAADRFGTLAEETSLLVARIDDNGQCLPIIERNGDTPRATGSVFKIWVLGGVADALMAGDIRVDDTVPLVAAELARGGTINSEPLGTPFPLRDMATLMMGISDNSATDHLHELVGRSRIETVVQQFGNTHAGLMTPFPSVNEQFHLFFSVSAQQATDYLNGTELFQRDFMNNVLVPLGPVTAVPRFHEFMLIDGSWRASPRDVCAAFSALRRYNDRTDAFSVVDTAHGSQAAQPGVRNRWQRVWYKGGSLSFGTELRVLAHAWMLESDGRGAFAVVALANRRSGVIDTVNVQSVLGRVLQLVDQQN